MVFQTEGERRGEEGEERGSGAGDVEEGGEGRVEGYEVRP